MLKFFRMSIGLVATAIFMFHIGAVGIYLMPDSPVRRIFDVINVNYTEKLWSQNWRLFSPNPPTSMNTMHVQCTQGDLETPWIDTNSQVIEKAFFNPVSVYPKLRYIYNEVHNQMLSVVKNHSELMCGKPPQDQRNISHYNECVSENEAEAVSYLTKTAQYQVALRFAYDACKRYLPSEEEAQIKMRIVMKDVFPFSQRHLIGSKENHNVRFFDFPEATFSLAKREL